MTSIPDSAFRTSSYSQPTGGNCVEVANLPGTTAIRDTQNRAAGHLEVPSNAWAALVAAARTDSL
ncbi:DUF397 domain-containing protein [Nocardiopsis ansamitocini]|uniref:DUF397 domain-containing protein n=1 Tax=Nocardiopsis ansamitocini TaxID=1670832 RepID=A0A9W6P5D0_9ACTN|nr:DUF397 domain-containing protein [Nocardiopsis ansamitocini]GLU47362.1 hypothetical protein Nans01_17130 [Nocardiopsis ansamitocini]